MDQEFCRRLSELRKDRGVSQRKAAADLKISQALLSHYENGAREPGLVFVCRACDYYGVTADYILGRDSGASRVSAADTLREISAQLRQIADRAEESLEA